MQSDNFSIKLFKIYVVYRYFVPESVLYKKCANYLELVLFSLKYFVHNNNCYGILFHHFFAIISFVSTYCFYSTFVVTL